MTITRWRKPKNTGQRQTIGLRRRKGGRNWGVFLLVILLLYFGYCSWGQIRLIFGLRREIAKVKQEIDAAQQQSEQIAAEIEYLKSDSYIEKVARQELGLVKPGEIIFVPEVSFDRRSLDSIDR
ncbi:MAG: septum formation initiator family protein [Firmicutes bacterium]|nr:septum formation initiator family protein [Bacillota bacterium]